MTGSIQFMATAVGKGQAPFVASLCLRVFALYLRFKWGDTILCNNLRFPDLRGPGRSYEELRGPKQCENRSRGILDTASHYDQL